MIKLEFKDSEGKKITLRQNWVSTRKMLDGLAIMEEKLNRREYVLEVSKYIAEIMETSQDELLDNVSSEEWDKLEDAFWTQLMGNDISDPKEKEKEES